jgi:thioesterase domain-containing protein
MVSVGHKTASDGMEKLASIWQRVLQEPSLGVEDHFFDRGETLGSADMLFAEIAREFNRRLPSSTIYQAPSIRSLAALLALPQPPRFSPLVKIKDGAADPPIFIVHGLAGTVPFFGLARHIRTGNAVYGIQAQGLDGVNAPLDRIEDMAALYLAAIKSLQPHGPYILIGYSFGGLVALEMARRLTESGEPIALLALVDAYPDPRYLSPVQRLLLFARRSKRYVFESKHRWNRALRYLAPRLASRLGSAGANPASDPLPETSPLSFARTTLQVKEKAYVALARYRPRFYGGKIIFLKSESDSYFPANPIAVWQNLASEFHFQIVPGGHLDMLTTDSERLAIALTRYIQEAPRNP